MLVPCYSIVCQIASMLTISVCSVFSHHQICGLGWVEEYTTDSRFERCWEGGDAQVSIIVLDNNQDYTYTCTYNRATTTTISSPTSAVHQQTSPPRPSSVMLCCCQNIYQTKVPPSEVLAHNIENGELDACPSFSNNMCPYQITLLTAQPCHKELGATFWSLFKRPFAGLAWPWSISAKFDLPHLGVQMCLPWHH